MHCDDPIPILLLLQLHQLHPLPCIYCVCECLKADTQTTSSSSSAPRKLYRSKIFKQTLKTTVEQRHSQKTHIQLANVVLRQTWLQRCYCSLPIAPRLLRATTEACACIGEREKGENGHKYMRTRTICGIVTCVGEQSAAIREREREGEGFTGKVSQYI